MEDIIKSAKNILKLANSPKVHNEFNNEVDRKTKEYQKVYGFEISDDPKHPTWNNEADAFKHAYMSAMLSIKYDEASSKSAGLKHELENLNAKNPKNETNMDLHNNNNGYEIAREVKEELKMLKGKVPDKQIEDMVAKKVMERMKSGQLITTPNDPRAKTIPEKMEDFVKGISTGYATDIPEDKIFTAEEIGRMSSDEFQANEKAINNQLSSMGVPREFEAQEAVQNGSMIWVNSYTRDDGTEVKGYYRSKPSEG